MASRSCLPPSSFRGLCYGSTRSRSMWSASARHRGSDPRKPGPLFRPSTRPFRLLSRGFSHIETMVALLILAIALVPALEALRPGLAGAAGQRAYLASQQRLKARMEEVLANDFRVLDTAATANGNSTTTPVAAYSDASGTPDRRLTTIYRYDGTAQTATDTGLLRIRVAIEGSVLALETLKAR